jgi:ATP-binding cassette subfamily B protein
LERLPEGLQTSLGEGGGLVSGGEGQRVRIARGLLRPRAHLVVLDEPFRALERSQRRDLLREVRAHWRDTTLLCITHDVVETLGFDRVLVLDGGQVVEDGVPADLAREPSSRYRALIEAEAAAQAQWRSGTLWRRLCLGNEGLEEARAP